MRHHLHAPSPYLLLVLTTLFWAGNVVLGRAMNATIPPMTLSFWRWTLALLIVLPFSWTLVRRDWPLIRPALLRLAILAILGVANYNTFVYIGLQTTPASSAVLIVSTAPVLIVALSFVLLRHTINRWQALGIVVSMLGVACILLKGDLTSMSSQTLGDGGLWLLAAALSWAGYSVYMTRWRIAGLHPLSFLTVTIAIGSLALLPFYLLGIADDGQLTLNAASLATFAYVAVFPSVLAYVFWNRAVAELGPNRSGQFLHLMPAFGALLSVLILGERFYAYHWIGIAGIAGGIYLATVLGRRAGHTPTRSG